MILNLEPNGTLRMAGARGVTVEVLDGHVWITRAGRAQDLILARGTSYEVEGEGVVLVGLERRVRLDLRTGGKAPWWRRLARAWAAAADARRANWRNCPSTACATSASRATRLRRPSTTASAGRAAR
jgi:hypothetical protein